MPTEQPSRYEEFYENEKRLQELTELLSRLIHGAVIKQEGRTLKVSSDAAFIHNTGRFYYDTLTQMQGNPAFSEVRDLKSTSVFSIEARLTNPIPGIEKIEVHFNKDM